MDTVKKPYKVTVIGQRKGGVGKSSVVFGIANVLARQGVRVLVIDLDSQANQTTRWGLPKNDGEPDACNIFSDKKPIHELIHTTKKNVYVIKGSIALTNTVMELSKEQDRFVLEEYLVANPIEGFTHILIDTSPDTDMLNQNAYMCADSIVLVAESGSKDSLDGAVDFIRLWQGIREKHGREDNLKAMVVNKAVPRNKIEKRWHKSLMAHEFWNKFVLKTILPLSTVYKEVEATGEFPKRGDKYAKPYEQLVEEMKERGIL